MSVSSWGRALLVAAVVVAPAVAGAQAPAPGAKIALQDAIALALRQSVQVKQSENAVASSNTTVESKQSAFLPTLSLNTSTARSVGRAGSGSLAGSSTAQSLSTGISSQLVVFDGLRNVNELRAAKLDVAASTNELTRARQTAVYTVATDYLNLSTAEGQLAVQKQNLAAQEEQEKQLQVQVKAGARSISDLYQQQATTASARAGVVAAEQAVELARIALIQTLQLDPRETYDFVAPSVADASSIPHYDLDSLLTRAFAARSDLAAEQTRVSAAAVGTKAAASTRLPTVSLTTNYNANYNSALSNALGDQLDQSRGGSVSIGVSFPLFDRGATSVAVQQAKIQEDNARLQLADQKQAVALDVRRAYLALETSRQQLAVALAQQKAADLAVSTTQARYQVGTSSLLELTQARASQLQAATAVVNAKNALAFQNALMPYYTGELDPSKALLQS
jgi:outer membrane protein